MKDTDIASANFEKFWQWLNNKYPPISRHETVHVSDAGNGQLNIYYCFQYGLAKTHTQICTIQMYPMFDKNFNPQTFYESKIPCKPD